MLIKIRNSLAINGIRCRIFKNQPPQTHKSPLVGWSKLIFNTFTSPQGGAKLLLLGEKLSSHFTVHSHFTAPKPRCSSWGISYLHASGTISSQKSASSRDGSTQRRADDAKSVTQPSARSQCSTDDATVEKFGKISHWAKAYFMEGWMNGWTAGRQPTSGVENPRFVQSIDRNPRYKETQISRKSCVNRTI